MATQNITTADAILKDLYVGPIVEQLNQKTYLLDQIDRDTDHVNHVGRRAIVPVHSNRNRGRVSIADGGTLPGAGKQSWLDAIIPIRYHTYGIELTDQAIEATKANEGAFISIMEAETKGVATDMRKDINRQSFGTGDGLLATVVTGGAAGTTTFTVDSVQYLQIGDPIDILVKATGVSSGAVGAVVTGRSITGTAGSSTQGQGTITISGPATTATVDTTYGVYLSGSRSNEMDGLRNITASGRTLHSIDSTVAGQSFWDGQQLVAAFAVAGESLFEQLADRVGQVGNGEVEVFLTTRGVRRRLADTYTSQKRYNDAKAVDIHGGFSAIMVNEIPVIADDDCPKGFAFGFNKSALKWFEQTKPGFLESSDGYIFHLKDAAAAGAKVSVWQAWFRWYAALAAVAPNRTGRITQCADDNPI